MPFDRSTGIGSTCACADHSYNECCFESATISLPFIAPPPIEPRRPEAREVRSRRQLQDRKRQYFCCAQDIVNRAVLIRLMREIELAGTVGNALRHAGNPRDVLVIVGAGASDEGRLPAEDLLD